MENSDNIRAINSFIKDFPLQDILETAECVVTFLPPPASTPVFVIIKVIKLLLKFRPAAEKALETGANIVDSLSATKEVMNASNKETPERANFNSLLELAASDGIISTAEKEFLHNKAKIAGIDDDEFELLILNSVKS